MQEVQGVGQGLAVGTWHLSAAGKVTQTARTTGQTAHMGPRHLGSRLQTLCPETPDPFSPPSLSPVV